jgi:hypothetical protein
MAEVSGMVGQEKPWQGKNQAMQQTAASCFSGFNVSPAAAAGEL